MLGSAPGLKFGFRATNVAISFGNYTSDEVLVAYRIDGQDVGTTGLDLEDGVEVYPS